MFFKSLFFPRNKTEIKVKLQDVCLCFRQICFGKCNLWLLKCHIHFWETICDFIVFFFQNPGFDFSGAEISGNFAGGGPDFSNLQKWHFSCFLNVVDTILQTHPSVHTIRGVTNPGVTGIFTRVEWETCFWDSFSELSATILFPTPGLAFYSTQFEARWKELHFGLNRSMSSVSSEQGSIQIQLFNKFLLKGPSTWVYQTEYSIDLFKLEQFLIALVQPNKGNWTGKCNPNSNSHFHYSHFQMFSVETQNSVQCQDSRIN